MLSLTTRLALPPGRARGSSSTLPGYYRAPQDRLQGQLDPMAQQEVGRQEGSSGTTSCAGVHVGAFTEHSIRIADLLARGGTRWSASTQRSLVEWFFTGSWLWSFGTSEPVFRGSQNSTR